MDDPGSPSSPPPGFSPADQQPLPILGRRSRFKREDEKVSSSDNLANVIVYLSSLYSRLKEDEENPAAAATPADPGQKVLHSKRLPRTGATAEYGFAGLGQRSDGGSLTGVWGENGANNSFARLFDRRGAPLAALCAVLLVALGVMTVLFLQERSAVAASRQAARANRFAPVAKGEDPEVTDEALNFSSLALDAIGRGETKKALDLLEGARNRQLVLPGMAYQGVLLASTLKDDEKMEIWMDRAMAANEAVPECLYLRATRESSGGDFRLATVSIEAAARNASFSPRYLFFWAECLRRQGTPRLAVPQFKEALRRRASLADSELILFKSGLARIEAGDDPDIQADLASRLAQEPVSGDTLLLAAANEINRNAFPAAAEFLRRAGQAMPLATLRLWLRDYVFRSQSEQKDIAPVWTELGSAIAAKVPTQPGRKSIVDPATRGLAEADPAGW